MEKCYKCKKTEYEVPVFPFRFKGKQHYTCIDCSHKEELIIQGSCSEATMRIDLRSLKENEIAELEKLLGEISSEEQDSDLFESLPENRQKEIKEKWYDTYYSKKNIFGIPCIEIHGDTPFNNPEWITSELERLKFSHKLNIETGD